MTMPKSWRRSEGWRARADAKQKAMKSAAYIAAVKNAEAATDAQAEAYQVWKENPNQETKAGLAKADEAVGRAHRELKEQRKIVNDAATAAFRKAYNEGKPKGRTDGQT